MSKKHRLLVAVSVAVLVVGGLVGVAGCSNATPVDSAQFRQNALAALEKQAAWKVTTQQFDGHIETEWWSAHSPYYRWDDDFGGVSRAATATDGKSIIQLGPDGVYFAQDLGADAARPVTPTAFSAYYWYLKQGKSIEASISPGDPNVVTAILEDAPSELTFLLDGGTYLPVGYTGRSEMTGKKGASKVTLQPTDVAAVQAAVEQLASQ